MNHSVSYDFKDESFEAKARWFQSLSIDERMPIFCELIDLLLENNPDLVRAKDIRPIPGVVRVFSEN